VLTRNGIGRLLYEFYGDNKWASPGIFHGLRVHQSNKDIFWYPIAVCLSFQLWVCAGNNAAELENFEAAGREYKPYIYVLHKIRPGS